MEMEEELKAHILKTVRERGRSPTDFRSWDSLIEDGLLDSLSLLKFVVFLEQRYKIKIPGEDIVPEHFDSLGSVVNYLRMRLASGNPR